MLLYGHWLRCFLFHRSRAQLKLGHLSDALRDIQACLSQYAQNKLEDVQMVRCLCLQVTITREISLHASEAESTEAFVDSLELMRKAVRIAAALAEHSGSFVPDCNVTYARSNGAIKHHHMMSPLLHNFTDLHANESTLSSSPQFNRRKLLNQFGITIPSLESKSSSEDDQSLALEGDRNDVDGLRLSPLDRSEGVYSAVEYVNISLLENRVLITCQAVLCKLLDDTRNAGLADDERHASYALVNEQLVVGEMAAKVCILLMNNYLIMFSADIFSSASTYVLCTSYSSCAIACTCRSMSGYPSYCSKRRPESRREANVTTTDYYTAPVQLSVHDFLTMP